MSLVTLQQVSAYANILYGLLVNVPLISVAPTQVDGDQVTSDISLQSSGTTPSVTFSFGKVINFTCVWHNKNKWFPQVVIPPQRDCNNKEICVVTTCILVMYREVEILTALTCTGLKHHRPIEVLPSPRDRLSQQWVDKGRTFLLVWLLGLWGTPSTVSALCQLMSTERIPQWETYNSVSNCKMILLQYIIAYWSVTV